jgi:uncharacterized protein YdaU (DUF1376 family)
MQARSCRSPIQIPHHTKKKKLPRHAEKEKTQTCAWKLFFFSKEMSTSANKRIQRELREMDTTPPATFRAAPLPEDMFEWHFTLLGA